MRLLAHVLVLTVAALHVAFMVAEMFFWQHPIVMSRFGLTPEFAKASAVMAANQGIYNGVLAAALTWALVTWRRDTLMVLLGCIVVVGIYGAFSFKPTIILVQALPALLALMATWQAGRTTKGVR